MSAVAKLNQTYGQQDPEEMDWLLRMVTGAKSILEIGSCFGHSLRLLASAAAPGARICSIDLGHGTHALKGEDTGAHLLRRVASLREQGFDAEVLLSDSSHPMAHLWAQWKGPFDFVFIDGDHSYAGSAGDWEMYGKLGKVVGFHDIAYEGHEVRQLWAEIKSSGEYRTDEKICSRMGIGIVYRKPQEIN